MKKQALFKFSPKALNIALGLTMIVMLAGCTQDKYPENAVAVINKVVVTEDQISNQVMERELYIKIIQKYREEPDAQIITPPEGMLLALNTTESDLNDAQKRYYSYLKEKSIPLTENEAFNQVVRNEVLYQEAIRQGFRVTEEKALEILKASDAESLQAASFSPEEIAEYEHHLSIESEALKEYGFLSREDYWYARHLPESARAFSINLMKGQFNDKIAGMYPNLAGVDLEAIKHNAWENYTEYLMRNSIIKVLNTIYSLSFTGQDWPYGRWEYTP